MSLSKGNDVFVTLEMVVRDDSGRELPNHSMTMVNNYISYDDLRMMQRSLAEVSLGWGDAKAAEVKHVTK